MTKPLPVQHKATILVDGRNVDIHAPPFTPVNQLESWLHDALSQPGRTLISKSWGSPQLETALNREAARLSIASHQSKDWQR